VVGGVYANSLSIITDAAHLLSDLAGFLISIFALWLAERTPTSTLSFGFHRAEILGALLSVLLIWLLTGLLIFEAVQRVQKPQHVEGKLMFVIASLGLVVNFAMGLILHQSGHSHASGGGHGHSHGGDHKARKHSEESSPLRRGRTTEDTHIDVHEEAENGHEHGHRRGKKSQDGHEHSGRSREDDVSDDGESHDHGHQETETSPLVKPKLTHQKSKRNINVTAAFIHVLGDAVQSVGVMIAAGIIWYNPNWTIVDPICTFFFSLIVLATTIRLVKESVSVLMEGSPEGIDPVEVEEALKSIKGVLEVHDLHIWSLSVGTPSLCVHLLAETDAQKVLESCHSTLAERWSIYHTTIQVESKRDQLACNIHYSPGPNAQTITTLTSSIKE